MTEESDESRPRSVSDSGSITEAKATPLTAEVTVAFSADNIRGGLDKDEYALALVLTSTRLENILTRGIRQQFDIDEGPFEKLWGRESLGTYCQMCVQLGVFEDTFNQETIDNVANLRNNLVHEYGYLNNIEEDEDVQQEVQEAIEEAIAFIEQVEV